MKKYLFFLLALVVASFAFISCSSDDDSDNGDYDKSMIVGTWEMTAVKTSETGTYVDWPFRKTYATFNADGSYYIYQRIVLQLQLCLLICQSCLLRIADCSYQ